MITIIRLLDDQYFVDFTLDDGQQIKAENTEDKRAILDELLDWGRSMKPEGVKQAEAVAAEALTAKEQAEQALATLQERYNSVIGLYPEWQPDTDYKAQDRISYGGTLYDVIQGHRSQADWTPDKTPALFKVATQVADDNGAPIILDYVQPTGAHDTYNTGDLMRYTDGKVYESTIDNNSWTPDTYPQGWQLREDLS